MSEQSNHHYVPQFYFRYFSTDGKSICLVNRLTRLAVRQASIRGQASKTNFYGEKEVEKALAVVEGDSGASLRKLIEARDPATLAPEDVDRVLGWVALQRSRTVAARDTGQPMHDKMLRMYLEAAIGSDGDLDEGQRQQLLTSLGSVRTNPAQAQLVEMKAALESAERLADLKPVMLINRTARPFIFGDAPVVFYNGYYRNVRHRGVLGFDTPGLMVFFPLSPTLALMLADSYCYDVKRVRDNQLQVRELRDVAALNKLQIHSASSCVYFHDFQFAGYVSELCRQERATLAPHVGTVIEAPGIEIGTGNQMGDIVHGFQPQLPYFLALSFLKHPVIGDDRYRFARRSERFAI